MQYRTGQIGRVIVAKAEHGDDLLKEIECLLRKEKVNTALLVMIGALEGADLVVGPRDCTVPPEPVWREFADGREIIGLGTVFSQAGQPAIHLHASVGKGDEVLTGCIRKGTRVYLVVEIIILELLETGAERRYDSNTMLHLLEFLG